MNRNLVVGQMVVVTHLQGEEVGRLESINMLTGKALVYFDYESCPHFDSFNLNQVNSVPLVIVPRSATLER